MTVTVEYSQCVLKNSALCAYIGFLSSIAKADSYPKLFNVCINQTFLLETQWIR
jgi:hypothetical protein